MEVQNRFEQSPELLKSRRNLIILSFVTISFLTLAPEMKEIKAFGLEITLSNASNIKFLLLFSLLFETAIFAYRYKVYNMAGRLSALYTKLQNTNRRFETTKQKIKDGTYKYSPSADAHGLISDAASAEIQSLGEDIQKSNDNLEEITSMLMKHHNNAELVMPCGISLFSIYWIIFDITKENSRDVYFNLFANSSALAVALSFITITMAIYLLARKYFKRA